MRVPMKVDCECTHSGSCAQREVWQTVEATVQNVLSTATIADLVIRQQHLVSRGMYYIEGFIS